MDKSIHKIIFWGTPDFVVPILETLAEEYEVVAVVTSPDKPIGRQQILTPPPIKLKSQSLNLKVLQPEKLKGNEEFLDILNTKYLIQNTTIGIVAAYGKIIPPEIFNLPEHGMLVVHPSLLPKYRGPTPVQSAILNGDKELGVTIMKMDEEVDHGDIISSANYQIPGATSFIKINSDLWQLGAELLIKTLPDYLSGKIKPRPQDHSQATFTHKFSAEDGEIKPGDDVLSSYNKIRALNPDPGTFIWFEKNGPDFPPDSKSGRKIEDPRFANHALHEANRDKKLRLKILDAELKNGHLEIKRVQLEGGKPMDIKEFITGHPNFSVNLL